MSYMSREELYNIENRPFSRIPDDYERWCLKTMEDGIPGESYGMEGRPCTKEEWENNKFKEEA